MEKNSHYFVIGIFVTVSIIALTFFVIWLAGTHDARNYDRYTVHFSDPVSGLKRSAVVQYRGVDVGRVLDVKLAPGRTDLITVDIEVDENTPIYKSSQASLATLGITGLAFIQLTTENDTDKTPPEKPQGSKYPIIQGKGTQLSKLFQDVPEISNQILQISKKLNTAFNEDNIKSVESTMRNIERISANIDTLLNEENVQNASVTLRNVASTSESLDELVARFNHTADEIDKAVSSINSVVTDNRADIDKFAGTGLSQITEMSRETRDMAKSIRRLADRLEQDPSRIIYQPTYRGVEIEK